MSLVVGLLVQSKNSRRLRHARPSSFNYQFVCLSFRLGISLVGRLLGLSVFFNRSVCPRHSKDGEEGMRTSNGLAHQIIGPCHRVRTVDCANVVVAHCSADVLSRTVGELGKSRFCGGLRVRSRGWEVTNRIPIP